MTNLTIVLFCAVLCATAAAQEHKVRALFDAFRLSEELSAPFNTGRLKVLYPEQEESEHKRSALPVVIFLPGFAVEANRYQWLGERIVKENGVIFVLYDVIVSAFGETSVLPTSEVEVTDDPPDEVLSRVLRKLERMNKDGTLAGRLDLEHVILGGHSLGGAVALFNADEALFPGVTGVFAYGTHLAERSTGYPRTSVDHLNGTLPVLLMGGTLDGVIVHSDDGRASVWNSPIEPIGRTYNEALDYNRSACIVEFHGFNHFSIVDPVDITVENTDLDFEATVEKETMKHQLSHFVSLFVRAYGWDDAEAHERLRKAIHAPHVARGACKG